jgi:hypothetical protein
VREAGIALIKKLHGVWITHVEPGEEVDVGPPVCGIHRHA